MCHDSSLFHAAEEVLKEFRKQFIKDVEADVVASDLRESGIIPQGCQEQISRAYGRKQRNEILHERLVTNCTREAFIRVCDVFIAEEGYPKMNALGEAMKKKLEAGKNLVNECAYCVRTCVCMCVLPV